GSCRRGRSESRPPRRPPPRRATHNRRRRDPATGNRLRCRYRRPVHRRPRQKGRAPDIAWRQAVAVFMPNIWLHIDAAGDAGRVYIERVKRALRILVALAISLGAVSAHAQRAFDQGELDAVLAPIALYPDPLVTHI